MGMVLTSERLTLVPFRHSDVDIAIELFTDPKVRRFTGGVMDTEDIRAEMAHWVRRGGNGSVGIWCVTLTDSGEKLGSAALLPMPIDSKVTDWNLLVPGEMPDADIEVGYFLKPSVWGKGIATEACRRVVGCAFEDSPLAEVVATFDPGNTASRGVLLKAGFTDRGTRRSYGENGPDFRITRDEWLSSGEPP
jgi:RimJ/RimL family protein N-acetyltransferase